MVFLRSAGARSYSTGPVRPPGATAAISLDFTASAGRQRCVLGSPGPRPRWLLSQPGAGKFAPNKPQQETPADSRRTEGKKLAMAEKFVAKLSEFQDGDRRIVFVGDNEIGVFRHGGQFY